MAFLSKPSIHRTASLSGVSCRRATTRRMRHVAIVAGACVAGSAIGHIFEPTARLDAFDAFLAFTHMAVIQETLRLADALKAQRTD